MELSLLGSLPDELLEAVIIHLDPSSTIAFGLTCRKANQITHEAVVWRRHCIKDWNYWHQRHELMDKVARPPAQTKWNRLYQERQRIDRLANDLFSKVLQSQQHRMQRIVELSSYGYDIKDLMLRLSQAREPPADDELARRFWSKLILAKLHREIAIQTWERLQNQQMVSLEQALGSYDLFCTAGEAGDLQSLVDTLDTLAQEIEQQYDGFEQASTRLKAIEIARYLRAKDLLGNDDAASYHALRNNYMTLTLSRTPHTSLPLQSAAIYCGVARRLGVDARPSNFPHHVYVVIKPPRDTSLDGRPRITGAEDSEAEYMYMDPWRSAEEVGRGALVGILQQMGMHEGQWAMYLGPIGTMDVTLRAGRNITTSVVETRNRERAQGSHQQQRLDGVDVDRAWYSMLWSTMLLGSRSNLPALQQRRRSCLPYLIEHYSIHQQEDIGLIERYIVPMFESDEQRELLNIVASARALDGRKKEPVLRTAAAASVKFKVGTHFMHKRYGYTGIIIGWDARCEAGEQWINHMRVNDLPKGREQPFYNVLADDKSIRYVAQENIEIDNYVPRDVLMEAAGRYFLRWDQDATRFVSNIKDEYPDD